MLSKLLQRKARDRKSLKRMVTNLVVAAGVEAAVAAAVAEIAVRLPKRHRVLRRMTACPDMAATLMKSGTSAAAIVPAPVASKPTFVHMLLGRMSSAVGWMMNPKT